MKYCPQLATLMVILLAPATGRAEATCSAAAASAVRPMSFCSASWGKPIPPDRYRALTQIAVSAKSTKRILAHSRASSTFREKYVHKLTSASADCGRRFELGGTAIDAVVVTWRTQVDAGHKNLPPHERKVTSYNGYQQALVFFEGTSTRIKGQVDLGESATGTSTGRMGFNSNTTLAFHHSVDALRFWVVSTAPFYGTTYGLYHVSTRGKPIRRGELKVEQYDESFKEDVGTVHLALEPPTLTVCSEAPESVLGRYRAGRAGARKLRRIRKTRKRPSAGK
jgi:hypothetical protein